jgi:hypothetical protein
VRWALRAHARELERAEEQAQARASRGNRRGSAVERSDAADAAVAGEAAAVAGWRHEEAMRLQAVAGARTFVGGGGGAGGGGEDAGSGEGGGQDGGQDGGEDDDDGDDEDDDDCLSRSNPPPPPPPAGGLSNQCLRQRCNLHALSRSRACVVLLSHAGLRPLGELAADSWWTDAGLEQALLAQELAAAGRLLSLHVELLGALGFSFDGGGGGGGGGGGMVEVVRDFEVEKVTQSKPKGGGGGGGGGGGPLEPEPVGPGRRGGVGVGVRSVPALCGEPAAKMAERVRR